MTISIITFWVFIATFIITLSGFIFVSYERYKEKKGIENLKTALSISCNLNRLAEKGLKELEVERKELLKQIKILENPVFNPELNITNIKTKKLEFSHSKRIPYFAEAYPSDQMKLNIEDGLFKEVSKYIEYIDEKDNIIGKLTIAIND